MAPMAGPPNISLQYIRDLNNNERTLTLALKRRKVVEWHMFSFYALLGVVLPRLRYDHLELQTEGDDCSWGEIPPGDWKFFCTVVTQIAQSQGLIVKSLKFQQSSFFPEGSGDFDAARMLTLIENTVLAAQHSCIEIMDYKWAAMTPLNQIATYVPHLSALHIAGPHGGKTLPTTFAMKLGVTVQNLQNLTMLKLQSISLDKPHQSWRILIKGTTFRNKKAVVNVEITVRRDSKALREDTMRRFITGFVDARDSRFVTEAYTISAEYTEDVVAKMIADYQKDGCLTMVAIRSTIP